MNTFSRTLEPQLYILIILSHVFYNSIFALSWWFCIILLHTQSISCVWLCDPLNCIPPSSSLRGISQARILEWIAISFSRGSSHPRDEGWVSYIDRQILYHWNTRKAPLFANSLSSLHFKLQIIERCYFLLWKPNNYCWLENIKISRNITFWVINKVGKRLGYINQYFWEKLMLI